MKKIKQFFNGFKEGFKEFGHIISTIINTILMLLVFIFGVGLVSIFMKLSKKEMLNLKKRNLETYWDNKINRNNTKEDSLKPY